ncbi:hypothetical protein C7H84_09580 [Burkholderia sp. Nafp2/4-1b]|uniref:BRO-N domain-containing protein n=1 Tax=Burkholderia sp. Nafp2/4-1b TaxID=2116686 RepID=UPI000EF91099|nr:Bro-N domain-containing protein [Burkholderia sp. Nafp2/4-1b]RKU03379.1 hypothetical protein C7H84_09580 [Burkholderia sp. Nafp2/4-1b]
MTQSVPSTPDRNSLKFHEIEFDVVSYDRQQWLRGIQIGYALGYQNPAQNIQKLYERNSTEFSTSMTAVVTVDTAGGPQQTRIFSLRGAHLLAMFARTPPAAEFRRWVLDILDREVTNRPPTSPAEVLARLQSGRWLLTFQGHNILLNPVPDNALVVAPGDLANLIETREFFPLGRLPKIITAAASRLHRSD